MIRLKHNKYPIWISFEGDIETFNKVKEFIAEDIITSGFQHYEAFEDVAEDETTVEPTGNDWINKAEKPKTPKKSSTAPSLEATIKHEDGTELSYGAENADTKYDTELVTDNVETKEVVGGTPSKTTKQKGGLGKFSDKK